MCHILVLTQSFTLRFIFAYAPRLLLYRKCLDLVGVNIIWLCSRFKIRTFRFLFSSKRPLNLAFQHVFPLDWGLKILMDLFSFLSHRFSYKQNSDVLYFHHSFFAISPQTFFLFNIISVINRHFNITIDYQMTSQSSSSSIFSNSSTLVVVSIFFIFYKMNITHINKLKKVKDY